MSEDFMDFTQELLSTTSEAKDLSKNYLEARKEYAKCFNKLVVLLGKAGLDKSKKQIDNKIIELLNDEAYGDLANEYYTKMLEHQAEYKGLKLVLQAYNTHATGLMSIVKNQHLGEMSDAMQRKYNRNYEA